MVNIGEKIKQRRLALGLTQEELGARTELSKGFISQLERNQTSPSIATLLDILEALATDISDFFAAPTEEKVVFGPPDVFTKEDDGYSIDWLVPNAQKNALEPIRITIESKSSSYEDDPHEGEEFGYVLTGTVTLHIGKRKYKVKKGESFCFKPSQTHYIENTGKAAARIIWVSTPPSF